MFKNLFDLNYQRSAKEAIVFYFTYLLLFALLIFILGIIVGIFGAFNEYVEEYVDTLSLVVVRLAEILICIGFIIFFFTQKKLSNRAGVIFVATFLSFFGLIFGFPLMLIPLAYTTTLPSIEGSLKTKSLKKKILMCLLSFIVISFILFIIIGVAVRLENILFYIIYLNNL